MVAGIPYTRRVYLLGLLSLLPILSTAGTSEGNGEAPEVIVAGSSGRSIGLRTQGDFAFRVRFLRVDSQPQLSTPVLAPVAHHAGFQEVSDTQWGRGIRAPGLGTIYVSKDGTLALFGASGRLLTQSVGPPREDGAETAVIFTKAREAHLFGRGASNLDWEANDTIGLAFAETNSSAWMMNKATYVSHYYSTDGYAALGVTNETRFNSMLVGYRTYEQGQHVTWTAQGAFELYLMPAPTLDAGTQAYFSLIGKPPVPPLYAFGFFASRWGWKSRTYVEDTLRRFRDDHYPVDAIILDFEWFANDSDYYVKPTGVEWYDDFGYNPSVLPNPKAQLAQYRSEFDVRFGGIRKPRLGNEENLRLAKESGWLAPPGGPETYAEDRWLLFEDPAERAWYGARQAHYYKDGVDFWWNDEGENTYFNYHWWNVAQQRPAAADRAQARFFSLNRAFSPGMARLGATVWTGDVVSSWADLARTPATMLNWALAGAPYVTCDIGGFWFDPTDTTLISRWYQVGVFLPIMRVHSRIEFTPRFPWLWGKENSIAMRHALELRYSLIPYHYSLAHALYSTGSLWMRPLVMDFPSDPRVANLTTEWMDGRILVAPVLRNDSMEDLYLPAGMWYRFGSACTEEGPATISAKAELDHIPAFVRAGSVVTLAPVVQHTGALPGGPLDLQVYAGASAHFDLVEDDGETTAYEDGHVRTTRFTWDEQERKLSWHVDGFREASSRAFAAVTVTLFERGQAWRSPTVDLGNGGSVAALDLHVADELGCPRRLEHGQGEHRRLHGFFV